MLNIPAYLLANPQYYDYIRTLEFKANSIVEIIEGSGQLIRTYTRGKYKLQPTAHQSLTHFQLYDMGEYDPYSKEKILDITDYPVYLIQEKGVFAFKQEVVWKIENADEHPCLLYNSRYLFSYKLTDLQILRNDEDFNESLDIYYSHEDCQTMTIGNLKKLGITTLN